jgi:7-cyano-7-deazaguanine synthase in queuosine biosynthesis
MSLNLNSLLRRYGIETSPLSQFFWRKERRAEGVSYPIPLKQQYVDFLKVVLGLHLIEMEHIDYVKEIEIETSYPYSFYSIVDKLASLFYILSDMKVKFRVISTRTRSHWQRLDEHSSYEKIIPFSGGLDSLCGALKLCKSYKVILAHSVTNQVIFNRVLELSSQASLQRSILYCCDARTKSTTGGISETRGFLFLSFAYAVAASLGLRSLVFCENGSQMLDVMLGSLIYPNKQATKNTNLIYVNRIEEIFSDFDDERFRIESPFKDMTKAEILIPFKNIIRFDKVFSCFSTRGRTAMCGICYNCFIRRVSLLAIDVNEKGSSYEANPFRFDSEMSKKQGYMETMDIIFHLVRFYHKILMNDPVAMNEIRMSARDYFTDPMDLATRFAKDIFLGIMKLLSTMEENQLNALGKKAEELLNQLDKATLLARKEELMNPRHESWDKGSII